MAVSEPLQLDRLRREEARRGAPPILAAAWGACLGWCPAVITAALVRAGVLMPPAILGLAYSIKSIEKTFFLVFYASAVVFACLAARNAHRFRDGPRTAISLALFIAFAPWIASVAIHAGPLSYVPALPPIDPRQWPAFARSVTPLAYLLIVPIIALALPFLSRNREETDSSRPYVMLTTRRRELSPTQLGAGMVACIVVLAVCLFPGDVVTVAARIGYNMHPVSFYIAPALFARVRGLIPGIDYFPQYGIGIGPAFAPFLRPTAFATIVDSIFFTAGFSLFYFATALVVLRRIYGSLTVSMLLVFFCLMMNFHTPQDQRLAVFMEPSTWPVRYPFFFVFVYFISKAAAARSSTWLFTVAGATAGLSLFWNTETGLYMIAISLLIAALFGGTLKRSGVSVVASGFGVALAFLMLSLITYGPGILQLKFFVGIIKPLTIYEAGFGSVDVAWTKPQNIVVACLSPILGFATIGWAAFLAWRLRDREARRTLATLFALAFFANCLMLKWVNMSYAILWQVNALPILAVGTWWMLALVRFVRRTVATERANIGLRVAGMMLACTLLAFLWFDRDGQDPTLYALRAFKIYPSIALTHLTRMPHRRWDDRLEVRADDLALIRTCSDAPTALAVISEHDWTYYLASGRTPEMPWMPVTTIDAFPFLVSDAVLRAGPIFVDRRLDIGSLGGQMGGVLNDRLDSDYIRGGTSKTLRLMLRRDVDRSVLSKRCLPSGA